jgi:general secretion pathway protein G
MTEPHPNRHPRPAEAGFTLVEIMVVIVILGLLATMVAKNVIGAGDEARVQTTMGSLRTVHDCVEMYASMTGKLPGSLEELQSEEVQSKPYYLREEPKDAWGNPLVLRGDSKRDFEVISFGIDGLENTEDDLSSRKKKE